jgi:hypothetical protein
MQTLRESQQSKLDALDTQQIVKLQRFLSAVYIYAKHATRMAATVRHMIIDLVVCCVTTNLTHVI